MPTPEFQPGFRFSVVDGIVIINGVVAATADWPTAGWLSLVIAFVMAHFFLFCNVFRVARTLELIWSALFIALAACTITFGQPPWSISIAISLLATIVVIALEMRKASYHGVLWRRINPGLPEWWENTLMKSNLSDSQRDYSASDFGNTCNDVPKSS